MSEQFLSRRQPGQEVLINGASGGMGAFAVQIAKALQARATAVVSTRHVDLARSLGTDHVMDYTREDALARNGQRYDLILAVNSYHPIAAYRHVLRLGGSMGWSAGTRPNSSRRYFWVPGCH